MRLNKHLTFLALSILFCEARETGALGSPGRSQETAAETSGVTLYEHDNFRGDHETFYGDDANLRDNKIGNDRVSSVRVAPGCTVTLYQHVEYKGSYTTLTHDAAELGSSAVGSDAVSSLEVSCGVLEPSPADAPAELGSETVTDRLGFTRSFQVASTEKERPALDAKILEELTVMITVTFDDESVEHGAGVLLCQEGSQAYVLTARHVMAGKDQGDGGRSARLPARTEVRLLHDSVPSVVDEGAAGEGLVDVHSVPDDDLAVLSLQGLGHLERTVSAFGWYDPEHTAPGVRSAGWARAVEPRVVALGYRKPTMETWAKERGTLLPGDGRFFYHSAAITEGFSGGPLFHESGALIGINLERVAGEAIGAEDGVFYGKALALDDVLPQIGPWLPEGCLRNLEEDMDRHRDALTATAFFAEADRMEMAGSHGKFRFGPYRITSAHRGWIRDSGSKLKRKYSFSLDDSNGAVWKGKCKENVKTKKKDHGFLSFVLDRVFHLTPDLIHDYGLSCSLERQNDAKTVELVIHERKDGNVVKGSGTAGAIRIEETGRWSDASYALEVDGRMVAAVTENATTMWLDPSVTGETRSACVVTGAALLLHTGFDLMDR